ncbi:MAG: F0F1 ATP synthase subunit A, partial [Myxococcaceae bacterium]|nr:F0F1 ATP synthase subunit A [Myxococcaceae bacterium]
LFMNMLGLIPNMFTATGNISLTAGLAICTFVLTQVASIRAAGVWGFIAHLGGGLPWYFWPIMVPVEIIGLFTKPIALMIRLFANMVAGHIVLFFLLGLIFMLHPAMAAVSVPMAVAIFMLEIFVGFVQAFIFTMLSGLFIGMGVAMGHHGHDEHKDEQAAAH